MIASRLFSCLAAVVVLATACTVSGTPVAERPSEPADARLVFSPSPAAMPTLALPTPAPTSTPAPVVERGSRTGLVALTLDMGATGGEDTEPILDLLRENGIRATHFLTGKWAEENSELARRIAAEGHELGNHSYAHPHFPELSEADRAADLVQAEVALREVVGVDGRPYFRPPFGEYDEPFAVCSARRATCSSPGASTSRSGGQR